MSKTMSSTVSDSDLDRIALELYRSLTPEHQAQVNAYLQALSASACIPTLLPLPPR